MNIEALAFTRSGESVRLPNITLDPFGNQEDNDILSDRPPSLDSSTHYQELRRQRDLEEWFSMGVFTFRWAQMPAAAVKVQIRAIYRNIELDAVATANTVAYAAHSPSKPTGPGRSKGPEEKSNYYIQVQSPLLSIPFLIHQHFKMCMHQVRCSNDPKSIRMGEYAVFHAKTNFPFRTIEWMVVASHDVIVNSGRVIGANLHPEVVTFR